MKYSFVIPCYRSENTVSGVVAEIEQTALKEGISDYEIILVNDCSPDGVWNVISELADKDEHIKGIDLVRNFGQHAALLAGYSRCTGDYIVSLDDDGQTPVNELRKLIDKLEEGNDVVFAYYEKIQRSLFRRIGTSVALTMCRLVLGAPKDFNASSFYIAKRIIIDEMIKYKNAFPYIGGLILRTTRKIGYVKTSHRARMEGSSGYSIKSLLSLWINGFTAFSVKPLEISSVIGILFAVLGFIGVIVTIVNKLIHPEVLMGWSSIISVILFIGGIQLLMLGLIGEYIGRIYICINNSPQYVIRQEKTNKNDLRGCESHENN